MSAALGADLEDATDASVASVRVTTARHEESIFTFAPEPDRTTLSEADLMAVLEVIAEYRAEYKALRQNNTVILHVGDTSLRTYWGETNMAEMPLTGIALKRSTLARRSGSATPMSERHYGVVTEYSGDESEGRVDAVMRFRWQVLA
ncbi:MAG: hypothetical protein LBG11_10920 [Bifidobacteriaceae bacterium]|nr:hypothetical protein [Bifidobacteriaceae bacterium]